MGKVCELIGSVVDGELRVDRMIEDEVFYTVTMRFKDTVVPVLFSSYINSENLVTDTKYAVKGCIMSDIEQGNLPVFYFYVNSMKVVDMDSETTNIVSFSCTVTKVKEFDTNSRGIDILPLVGSDASPLSSTSILYLCARKSLARKLKDKPKGYTITGRGYLKQYRDVYEIYIMDIENSKELFSD